MSLSRGQTVEQPAPRPVVNVTTESAPSTVPAAPGEAGPASAPPPVAVEAPAPYAEVKVPHHAPAVPTAAALLVGQYVRRPCGEIEDTRSKLTWFVGPDRTVTWSEAQIFVQGLQGCDHDWRMPTTDELASLYRADLSAGIGYFTKGARFPAHIAPVFAAIGEGSWVWAGEVGVTDARVMNFFTGRPLWMSRQNQRFTTRAFAVSGPR